MTDAEFDNFMDEVNRNCIREYGKTFCELIEDGEQERLEQED